MKAHISKVNNSCVLSVGMIVKNEEKYLDKCLSALKPLLDAVSSELVIVDTGSVDSTVEIAHRYTDKVFYFEWIDDFSAARNYGLSKCGGEWFMFLDADDIFNDLSEMIDFFGNSELHKEYSSAYYLTKNFTFGSQTVDTYVQRITRRVSGLKFVNPIHECFNEFPGPVYYFNANANHYGYSDSSGKKKERNLRLLKKQFEKNPNDIRTIWHILEEYSNNDPEKAEIIATAENLAKKSNSPFSAGVMLKIANYYSGNKNEGKAREIYENLLNATDKNNAIRAEIHALAGMSYFYDEMYPEAEENLKKYLVYYNRYKENKLDLSSMPFILSLYMTDRSHENLQKKYSFSLAKQGKVDEAVSFADEDYADLSFGDFINEINTIFSYVDYAAEYDKITEICDAVNRSCNDEKIGYLNKKLEALYYEDRFNDTFQPKEGEFARFYAAARETERDAVNEYITSLKCLGEGLSGAIYLAVKNNIALPQEVLYDFETINLHIVTVTCNRSDFPDYAAEYMDDSFFKRNVVLMAFGTSLFNISALCFGLSESIKNKLYERFIPCATGLVNSIYNPALLNDSDISVLPGPHRIAYYALKEEKEKDNLDESARLTFLSRPSFRSSKISFVDKETKEKAYSLAREHRTDDAIALYENTDFSALELPAFCEITDMIFLFTEYSLEYDKFTAVCDKINSTCDSEKTNYLNKKLETKLHLGSLSRRFKPGCGDFAELLRLINFAGVPVIRSFIARFDPLPAGLSEAFYLAVKYNIDLTDTIRKMDYETLANHISTTVQAHPEIAEHTRNYQSERENNGFYFADIKTLNFGVMLFDAVSNIKSLQQYSLKKTIYENLAQLSAVYVKNIYREEFLKDSDSTDICFLPESHRLGFYTAPAADELAAGNTYVYAEKLREALTSCPNKSEAIEFLLAMQ